jgi:hypothetical protein
VIAGIGISRTWEQFRPEGARFWAPFYDWADRRIRQSARSFGRAAKRRWNRFRSAGQVSPTTVRLGTAVETETAMPINPVRGNGNAVPEDAEAFRAFVLQGLGELRAGMKLVERGLVMERTLHKKEIDRLQRQVDTQHDRLRDMTQQVAVSGLPLEMTGLFFVVAGMVLQGIAQVL